MRFHPRALLRTGLGTGGRPSAVVLALVLICAGIIGCKRKAATDAKGAGKNGAGAKAKPASAHAPKTLVERIAAEAQKAFGDVVKLRRDLHQHPELSGKEVRTAKVVAGQLRALGLEVKTGVGGHGVVAVLKGARPGPVVAYRADMDAVPIILRERVKWRSKVRKVGHGCGHDLHTAIGVGIARVLSALKDRLPGTVKFIFQPAEENLNGAKAMIAQGALKGPKPVAIYALHTAWFHVGNIVTTPGVGLPGYQGFRIELEGSKGVATAARQALRAIAPLSTVKPPRSPAELKKFGASLFQKRNNPLSRFVFLGARYDKRRSTKTKAILLGMYRAMGKGSDAQAREGLAKALRSLKVPGVKHRLTLTGKSPAMLSDRKVATEAIAPLQAILGEGAVHVAQASVPFFGEDYAYYLQKVPGAMFWLGASNKARGINAVPHSPGFRVDEKAMLVGVKGMANVIFARLSKRQ